MNFNSILFLYVSLMEFGRSDSLVKSERGLLILSSCSNTYRVHQYEGPEENQSFIVKVVKQLAVPYFLFEPSLTANVAEAAAIIRSTVWPAPQDKSELKTTELLDDLSADGFNLNDRHQANDMLNTEWTEIEEIQLVGDSSDSYGITISGGRSTGVVVKSMLIGGIADLDNRLRVGDTILVVGGSSTRGMNSNQVAKMIRGSSSSVSIIVGRPIRESANRESKKMIIRTLSLNDPNVKIEIILNKAMQRKLNIQFLQLVVTLERGFNGIGITATNLIDERGDGISGIFITNIDPEGSAALDGRVKVFDQIEAINGVTVSDASFDQAVELIRLGPDTVTLRLKRYSGKFLSDLSRVLEGECWLQMNSLGEDKMIKSTTDFTSSVHPSPVDSARRMNVWKRIFGSNYDVLILDVKKSDQDNLGLRLEGTVASDKVTARHYINDLQIGSVAATDGKFKVKDEILQVNDKVVMGQPHSNVINILKSLPIGNSTFYVARKRIKSSAGRSLLRKMSPVMKRSDRKNRSVEFRHRCFELWRKEKFSVVLKMSERGLGLSFLEYQDSPLFSKSNFIIVRQVIKGGVAHRSGQILPGDRLVSVNRIDTEGFELSRILSIVRSTKVGCDVRLTFNRALSNVRFAVSTMEHN
ncbi:hypothetical protein ACOME3_005515 [Neoechinorhynchus agilis]